jgi:lipid-binding SYLF domain-containing protein
MILSYCFVKYYGLNLVRGVSWKQHLGNEGALRIDGKTVEYYSIAAGSVGFQIGAQKMNLILVFMQDEALKHFRTSSGWKVGVDGSVAFIDVGKGKSLDTINIKDPIVAFLFGQKGLMASATIEGAKFTKLVR